MIVTAIADLSPPVAAYGPSSRSPIGKARVYTPSTELAEGVLAGRPSPLPDDSRARRGAQGSGFCPRATSTRRGGRAHVVGITGVPGAGKSTLVSALIKAYAAEAISRRHLRSIRAARFRVAQYWAIASG